MILKRLLLKVGSYIICFNFLQKYGLRLGELKMYIRFNLLNKELI